MPRLQHRRSLLNLIVPLDNPDSSRLENNSAALPVPAPASPRPVSEYGPPLPQLSLEVPTDGVSEPGPLDNNDRARRFSMLKWRNFSESHLAIRARREAEMEEQLVLPMEPSANASHDVPAIVRTAPTMDEGQQDVGKSGVEAERKLRPSLFGRSHSKSQVTEGRQMRKSAEQSRVEKPKASSLKWRRMQGRSTGLEDLARLASLHAQSNHSASFDSAPPSYGDETTSAPALLVPDPRLSEAHSDGSNGSSGDHIYAQTTTTTHLVSTHTTFFRLPRRHKNRNSLFPLPMQLPPSDAQSSLANEPTTPRASTSAYSTRSLQVTDSRGSPTVPLHRRHPENSPTQQREPHPFAPSPHAAWAKGNPAFDEASMHLGRNDSQRSRTSSTSSPLRPPPRLGARDRASTTSSFGRGSQDIDMPPALTNSTRNSTSTTGRSSLGGLLNLSRFRQGSNPDSPRHSSPGTRSKSNSFAMSREALVIPEREEGDTPGKYLERLEAAVARSMIAGILSKSADPFAQAVLRSYTRRFPFFGEPIDMSLRKFLLEAELPKETQQVDRVIQAFADRYNECNPGIFKSPDQAYIIAFSLMMLHTDAFNKNNKRKMQKQDYIKNTSGQHVANEVLACFYDNICYTPFVHYEEEVDINGERVMPFQPKKSKLKGALVETAGKKPTGPVDPYNLLVEQKLDQLRPPVKDCITFDDPYCYRIAQVELDAQYLQRAFTHTGILQIISARSRPTAYEGQLSSNTSATAPAVPAEPQAGIIDLKITKVGTLWRKATKKKKARSPWQEWGAILTGSQLYLFKNAHWAKSLVQQFNAQQRYGQPRIPVIFKPPLTEFKPDALIKTDNAVALIDSTYTRHKHAFTFFRAGGQEEVLLADNDAELLDWLALINYAAAFRAAGVRIRGMVGGHEEDLRRRDVHRLGSTTSTRAEQTATGAVTVSRGGLSPQLQRQVMAARRQIMIQKIAETDREIAEANRQLDDLLRDARHLLILAPIAPKTRDDVLHAAARYDAMIKWARRDIWRMRCHRDILAMDVQQDGVSASELQLLTQQQSHVSQSSKKERTPAMERREVKTIAEPAYSPPQSPASTNRNSWGWRQSSEPGTSADVFVTPPDSAPERRPSEAYRLPPLQIDSSARTDHRGSITSTLLSVSPPTYGNLSHTSSTSSVRRTDSEHATDTPSRKDRMTPTPSSIEEREVEMLARTSTTPDTVALSPVGTNVDVTSPSATPEQNRVKGGGVRRSLQKTLRDAHHTGSMHKHRRGKDSDGTVRSGNGGEGENIADGTPGLQREGGRFILHGKQASVIEFGADWPNERMRQRREQWRLQNGNGSVSDRVEGDASSPQQSREQQPEEELTPRQMSISVVDTNSIIETPSTAKGGMDFGMEESDDEDEEDDDAASLETAAEEALREDAEAAEAYAATSSPVATSPVSTSPLGEGTKEMMQSGERDKTRDRQTVIGPRSRITQEEKGNDMVDSHMEDTSPTQKDNRRTVIGPSYPPPQHASTLATEEPHVKTGAEQPHPAPHSEAEGEEEDSMTSAPIAADELRRLTSFQPQVVRA